MILLVHGWGYDATVWDGVCQEIADLPVARVDLGFFGTPVALADVVPEGEELLLGVGHSLGFLWLLRHAPRCQALLSVNGFARFTEDAGYPGVPAAALELMRRRFGRNPSSTIGEFWRSCGAAPDVAIQNADRAALLRGLDWLRDWDEHTALAAAQRVSALAGRKDAIVSAEMSAAAFAGRDLTWADSGHALPLLQPRFVADAIRRNYLAIA